MYGSTIKEPLGSSTMSPLLGPPIATKEERDRRKQNREQKKQKSKSDEAPVFSRVFKQSTRSDVSRHPDYSFLYTALNPRSHQWQAILFKKFMTLVIVTDMILFIVSTEPKFHKHKLFFVSEAVASCVFFVEYMTRLTVCTEGKRYQKLGPLWGRLRYMVSSMAIIDAFATFPFFLELLTGIPFPTLTYLRFFRLLRLTKTDQFAKSMDACSRVLYYNRQILYVALFLCIFLVLFTSVLLYYLRPPDNEDFKSIPATMYMSTLLLTGQGGPDATDLPWYTKGVILATGVFSVAMFAIPASMLTWGFEAEAERLAVKSRKRAQKHLQARLTGRPNSFASSSSGDTDWSSSSIDTSDEEYQKIIAGGGDEEGGDEQSDSAILRELIEVFEKADADASESLSKEEFLNIVTGKLRGVSEQRGGPASTSFDFETPTPVSSRRPLVNPGSVSERMGILEAKVDSMHATLGRILQIVEGKRW